MAVDVKAEDAAAALTGGEEFAFLDDLLFDFNDAAPGTGSKQEDKQQGGGGHSGQAGAAAAATMDVADNEVPALFDAGAVALPEEPVPVGFDGSDGSLNEDSWKLVCIACPFPRVFNNRFCRFEDPHYNLIDLAVVNFVIHNHMQSH